MTSTTRSLTCLLLRATLLPIALLLTCMSLSAQRPPTTCLNMTLYPFDTTNGVVAHFAALHGGERVQNPEMLDARGNRSDETVYSETTTRAGEIIAEGVIGNDGAGLRLCECSAETAADRVYFIFSGHLFDGVDGGRLAAADDTLLVLTLHRQTEQGEATERVVAQIGITRGEFAPEDMTADYMRYLQVVREVAIADICGDGSAHDYTLRLRWTGSEKLALRSISVRDSISRLMYGRDAASNEYRQWLYQTSGYRVVDPETALPAQQQPLRPAGMRKQTPWSEQ